MNAWRGASTNVVTVLVLLLVRKPESENRGIFALERGEGKDHL